MGEFDVITRYFSSLGSGEFVDLSVGDDAAALTVPPNSELIVSTDSLVLDTHFTDDVFPEDVGYKAVASAVSDLAAMGAYPSFISIGLTSNSNDIEWYKKFTSGLKAILNEYQIKLIGGDVTFGEVSVCVNVFGYAYDKIVLRSNAKIGDLIYITGPLGEGRQGLIDWKNNKKSSYIKNFFNPKIPFNKSKYISQYASSCIDISDGLMKDLGSICKLSEVGAEIVYENIPITNDINDLSYGDDYKICYTCSPTHKNNEFISQDCCIGEIKSGNGILIIKDGSIEDFNGNGWDSFE